MNRFTQGPGCQGTGLPVYPGQIIGYVSGKPVKVIAGGSEDAGAAGENSGNPAWNDFLEYVPEDKREAVTPLLQQWDRGVQEKIQKVHQEQEPWKPIVQSGVDPETVQFGIELLSTLQTDPRKVFDALAENYGWEVAKEVTSGGGGSGQGQEVTAEQLEGLDPKQLAELAKRQDVTEQILLAQRQRELVAAEEAALDKALNDLRDKHGDYDEQDVVRRLAVDDELTPEEAYKASIAYADKIRSTRPVPPRIAGGGSGMIPAASVDVGKLTDKEMKKLVSDTLQQQIMGG